MGDQDMIERGPRGLGSYRIVKRKDGSLALKMKITLGGKYFAKQIDCPPKRKIEEARAAFVTEVSSGAYSMAKVERKKLATEPTLAEFFPVFLTSHVSQDPDRAATRTAYANMMRLYWLPPLGKQKISATTASDIRDVLQALYRNGRAVGTIKLAYSVMRLFLDAAIDDGYLRQNPMPKFGKLRLGDHETKMESAKRHALTLVQVSALLDCCGDPDLRLWVAIMASCGLRPGEATGLHWHDVNLKTCELHVRGAAKQVFGVEPGAGTRIWIGKPKTPSSKRTVSMGPLLASMLTAERDRQEADQKVLTGKPANVASIKRLVPSDGCVFPADPATPEGLRAPLRPDNLSARFRRAAIRAGLPGVTPHWLRHTAISHAIAEGASLADASRRAGHKNPAITAAIYTHAVGDGEKKAAIIGDKLLSCVTSAEEKRTGE
jgi:integrase